MKRFAVLFLLVAMAVSFIPQAEAGFFFRRSRGVQVNVNAGGQRVFVNSGRFRGQRVFVNSGHFGAQRVFVQDFGHCGSGGQVLFIR